MENIGKLFQDFEQVDKATWKSKIEKDLRGADFEEKVVWKTKDDLDVFPFYNHEDLNGLEYLNTISNSNISTDDVTLSPRNWLNVPEIKVDVFREANRKALLALNNGADGIVYAIEGTVDKGELSQLLSGIQLPYCSLGFKGNFSPSEILKHLNSYTEKSGFDPKSVKGSLDFNLKETPDEDLQEIFELLKNFPGYKIALSISQSNQNYPERVAGFLVEMVNFIEKAKNLGFKVKEIINQLEFSWQAQNNYFFEIAALRALRILVGQIATAYGLDNFQFADVKIHALTEIKIDEETQSDPYLNMLSNTNQAMSAIIGGCDAITVLPHNNGIEQTDDFAERIARNVSSILKEEAYLDKVADPAAGSYYIESLTDKLAEKAWILFLGQV